jgi:hypothetical protein
MNKKIFFILSLIFFFTNISFAYSGELLIYKELKLINKHYKKYQKNITTEKVIDKKVSISQKAFNNMQNYNKNISNNNSQVINVVFSKNVSDEIKNEELDLIEKGLKFFQNYYYTKDLNGVIFTSDSIEWADNFIKNSSYNEWSGNIKKSYKDNEICSFAFAMERYAYASCVDNDKRNIFHKQTSIHEIFHIVQAQNSNQYKTNNFGMPCWLLEGSATYFGSIIGINDLNSINIFINNLKYQFNDGSGDSLLTKLHSNKSKYIMKDIETINECKLNLAPYTMGYLATEILISEYGFEKFMTFIQSFNNNIYWKEDFESIFNLNIELFYDQVIVHAKNTLT